MIPELLFKMGKKAYVQSIKPYKGKKYESVAVFGLDTEYVPKDGEASDLICWQLAYSSNEGSNGVRLISDKPLTISNLYDEAKRLAHEKAFSVYVFVCFFSLAELQFFNLDEWQISEFKGKYMVKQTYGDGQLMVVDLANWYVGQGLAAVGKVWGQEKLEYPIGDKVEAIARGEYTKYELLHEDEFRNYAVNDAIITGNIYRRMREYFLETYDVDIVSTMTPANTSASMFRKHLRETIGQRDTGLRRMALKCCWGGRMECVYRGSKPLVHEYDATAHHPSSAMALRLLPLEKDWMKTSELNKWFSGIQGVGKVYFRYKNDEQYPCLPVWSDSGALTFPLEGVSFCSMLEAKLAHRQGANILLFEGYYYKTGTDCLTLYLQGLQDKRNASVDEAERQLLKLLSNSIIGKFFQKKVGFDLAVYLDYATEHQLPIDEVMRLPASTFETNEGDASKVTVGSCFYPEWYSIILGFARANIGELAWKYKALMISSDSLTIEQDLGDKFEFQNIVYKRKVSGDYVGYRARFYRIGDKIAHHAIHNKEAAKQILATFVAEGKFTYSARRFRHLKESWRHNKPFGSQIIIPEMTVDLGYDGKRLLEGSSGWTTPLRSLEGSGKVLPDFTKEEEVTECKNGD